jgi:predicted enzyme related to lactoylglutathione lyase
MSTTSKPAIAWCDLTVPDAVAVKDFYAAVVGWVAQGVDMGGYEDFSMIPSGSESAVCGICHARGPNADLPAVWMVYFAVADVDAAVREAIARGGSVLRAAKDYGSYGRIAMIRDPAGAACALWQKTT